MRFVSVMNCLMLLMWGALLPRVSGDAEVGQRAPDFSEWSHKFKTVSLADYKGQKLILWFYPGELFRSPIHSESGCAIAARGFQKLIKPLTDANVAVVGVSNDPIIRNQKFATDNSLTFPLISDVEHRVAEAYDAEGHEKNVGLYQKGVHRRVAVLIDENGFVLKYYEPYSPAHIAEKVLEDVDAMKSGGVMKVDVPVAAVNGARESDVKRAPQLNSEL